MTSKLLELFIKLLRNSNVIKSEANQSNVVLINNKKAKFYELLVSFRTQLTFKATSSRTLLICRLFLNSNSRLFVDYSCLILVEFKTHKNEWLLTQEFKIHTNEWLLPQEFKTQFDKLHVNTRMNSHSFYELFWHDEDLKEYG